MTGTHHIEADPGDFAELVLMPGDPLRAKALATGHLDEVRQINSVRNMLGFTGKWRGRPVSIMGSGMGMPSIGIYAHELFDHYGVQRIVRVGTCGGLLGGMQLGDIVLATAASTDSNMNRQMFSGWDLAAAADHDMLSKVHTAARQARMNVRTGEVFSTDYFYHPDPEFIERVTSMGILALDMESAILFALARRHARRAMTVLTVTDVIPRGEHASAAQRQAAFGDVISMLLDALLEDADV